ncbi:hypothetical protein Zmor_021573 [Zophobas morio]|uniref:Uncharacterized protein n=1 Tax=Zophobas morio TaxID=2755281 RepID=A0AA38I6D6_9CUCU|nr:hypothetical protein Zmor_021573 [Zophobas morio]
MKKRPASVTSDDSLGKFMENFGHQRQDGAKATTSFLSPTTPTNRNQSKETKTTDPLIESPSKSAESATRRPRTSKNYVSNPNGLSSELRPTS